VDPNILNKPGELTSSEYRHIMIANSDGRIVRDYQPMTGIYASCTAEQNGQKEEGYAMTSGRFGIEYYTRETMDALAKKTVDHTVLLFEAVKPEAGEMEEESRHSCHRLGPLPDDPPDHALRALARGRPFEAAQSPDHH
jgi:predicted Zn-dependent protease